MRQHPAITIIIAVATFAIEVFNSIEFDDEDNHQD